MNILYACGYIDILVYVYNLFESVGYNKKIINKQLPWHSLVAIMSKMVVHELDLHVLVTQVTIIVPKKHDLVLVSKPIVGDGHICIQLPSFHCQNLGNFELLLHFLKIKFEGLEDLHPPDINSCCVCFQPPEISRHVSMFLYPIVEFLLVPFKSMDNRSQKW